MNSGHLQYVAGLDGGGTKTAAELCAPDGTVLAQVRGGPTNFQMIGAEKAARVIIDLLETCAHSVGCTVSAIGSAVAGLTGAGRASDQTLMLEAIRNEAARRGHRIDRIAVESDARIALEGAFGGGPGIIVIAGTGSIVFGKDQKGGIHRAGGWGRLMGDEGSGYTIGREAFRAVAKMMDGAGPATRLGKLFTKEFKLSTQESIITSVYRQNFDIAAAAPLVLSAAAMGDRVAQHILDGATRELLGVIQAVVHSMNRKARFRGGRRLAFIGTLLARDSVYARKVRHALRQELPSTKVVIPSFDPAHGASLMAISALAKNGGRTGMR